MSEVKLQTDPRLHAPDSQQDPPVAEEHEQQRQEQAEDEQTDDVGASRARTLLPLDRADGPRTLRAITAPQTQQHNVS